MREQAQLEKGIYAVLMVDLFDAARYLAHHKDDFWTLARTLNSWAGERRGVLLQEMGSEQSLLFAANSVTDLIPIGCEAINIAHLVKKDADIRVMMHVVQIEETSDASDAVDAMLEAISELRDVTKPRKFLLSEIAAELAKTSPDYQLRSIPCRLFMTKDWNRVYQVLNLDLPSDYLDPIKFSQPLNNLPYYSTSFVGRVSDIEQIRDRFFDSRVVTVTGFPGVGKSRIAVQVAFSMLEDQRDGAWRVDLTSIKDPDFLPLVVADQLHVPSESRDRREELLSFLSDKELLLVLDNCEHISESVASLVTDIVSSAGNVHVLCASQEPLPMVGQSHYKLEHLPYESESASDKSPAHRLFVNRANLRFPDATYGPAELLSIDEICALLEGMPLAIELAAGQALERSPIDILKDLKKDSAILGGDHRDMQRHHRRLDALMQWSLRRLTEPDRKLLISICVFEGYISQDAAEAVARGAQIDADVPDTIERLTMASLVLETNLDDVKHWRLLRPMRDFLKAEAKAGGIYDSLRQSHFHYFLAWAKSAFAEIMAGRQEELFAEFRQKGDDLRAAVSWILEKKDSALAFDMIYALYGFWFRGDGISEGYRWAKLMRPLAKSLSVRDQSRMMNLEGTAARLISKTAEAEATLREAHRLGTQAGDLRVQAGILSNLSTTLRELGRLEDALEAAHQAVLIFEELNDQSPARYFAIGNQAMVYTELGRWEEGRQIALQSVVVAEEMKDYLFLGQMSYCAGAAALAGGALSEAQEHCARAFECFAAIKNYRDLTFTMRLLALCYCRQELYWNAAYFLGADEKLRLDHKLMMGPVQMKYATDAIKLAMAAIGPEAFEKEKKWGALRSLDELRAMLRGAINL